MKRLQRAVVIASLIQEMKDRGSWCGEDSRPEGRLLSSRTAGGSYRL